MDGQPSPRGSSTYIRSDRCCLAVGGQPLFERRVLYARSAADKLYITGFAAPLETKRSMVGTEKVFATSSLGMPLSTAASTLSFRFLEYGLMPRG